MSKSRELIILPKVNQAQLTKFLPQLEEEGIKTVYLDPKKLGKKKTKLKTISTSNSSNYVVLEKENSTKPKGRKIGIKFEVLSNSDIENVLSISKKGLDFVIIEVKDWKIIPLENIIAKLHKIHTKIFAIARTPEEVRKMFSILEVGVDAMGFIMYEESKRFVEIDKVVNILKSIKNRVEVFLVFVNSNHDFVSECLSKIPQAIPQFHGEEGAEFCESFNTDFVKAIRVNASIDFRDIIKTFKNAKMLLLDSYEKNSYGGSGKTIQIWEL